jgi:hypothetical protein
VTNLFTINNNNIFTLCNGLFQCSKWPRWHWYTSQHNYIHELFYNPMDRRWPTNMEPLQHRCTPYHKSHRGLAQQTEVESLPCAPKLLHIDQHIERHPGFNVTTDFWSSWLQWGKNIQIHLIDLSIIQRENIFFN